MCMEIIDNDFLHTVRGCCNNRGNGTQQGRVQRVGHVETRCTLKHIGSFRVVGTADGQSKFLEISVPGRRWDGIWIRIFSIWFQEQNSENGCRWNSIAKWRCQKDIVGQLPHNLYHYIQSWHEWWAERFFLSCKFNCKSSLYEMVNCNCILMHSVWCV